MSLRRGILLVALLLLPVMGIAAPPPAAPSPPGDGGPVSFNRDILPILSDTCFACHGPDAAVRKAGLRLDVEEGATLRLPSGLAAIVPGDVASSALIARISAPDPSVRMPPPESQKQLNDRQRNLLTRWIAEGAQWERHWAFVAPVRPALPPVQDGAWPRNPIDHFVLARLEEQGLSPAKEADRYTLIRRVSFDLTGLPPTPREVEQFVQDPDPKAYDALVERLLASPQNGEHMARHWLDLARYADTNGYAGDTERTMWRYRDWVIDAFNSNMRFDQFTLDQLAGDLLPNPTLEQRIATGFNRNNPVMLEGGVIFEEYRVQNVVDRVDTTATTWLGLTMKCAQCHDHKFDPISQREFYELSAFFNNVPEEESKEFGTELDGNSVPRMKAPLPEQQKELARLEKAILDIDLEKDRPLPEVDAAQREWEARERAAVDSRWVKLGTMATPVSNAGPAKEPGSTEIAGETTLPNLTALRLKILPTPDHSAGASISEISVVISPMENLATEETLRLVESAGADLSPRLAVDGLGETAWQWKADTGQEAVFSAASPFGFPSGTRVRVVLSGTAKSPVPPAASVIVSVTSDPGYLPATMGKWHVNGPYLTKDGASALETEQVNPRDVDLSATYPDGRAKWISLPGGLADGVETPLSGAMCATWFHRTITANSAREMHVALNNRNAVRLWVNGRLIVDKEAERGEVAARQTPAVLELREGQNDVLMKVVDYYDFNTHYFYFLKKRESSGKTPFEAEQILALSEADRTDEQRRVLWRFYRSLYWEPWAKLHEQQLDLKWELALLDKKVPTTMVMQEMNPPRQTHVLRRGEYDQPGEAVGPAVPAALHAWPNAAPRNRLGLAQWLLSPDNPLTARVVINRDWQRYFGAGFSKTAEDFGTRGELPSHPALLDWLSREFIDSGWDVKAMQRLIVTSATYRQDSRRRPEVAELDPENRLLTRGPRYRLDAERIRDSALAMSGLLVPALGGPSVKPYQSASLWKDVAYGGGGLRYTAQEFHQDHGEKLYRRSMYTFWKRAAPAPGMLLFDAPNRDTCTALRGRTNTPLQALEQMNDVQFVEAARALAERLMKEAGDSVPERINYAYLLALSRPVRAVEAGALQRQFEQQLSAYRESPAAAEALLAVGESPRDTALDAAELAAWTLVANAILNSDARLSQF